MNSWKSFIVTIVLILVLIVVGPLATIAALNTLFSLNIAYNFWTWLAVAWLCMVLNGNKIYSKG